jgi:hypothetical protein
VALDGTERATLTEAFDDSVSDGAGLMPARWWDFFAIAFSPCCIRVFIKERTIEVQVAGLPQLGGGV